MSKAAFYKLTGYPTLAAYYEALAKHDARAKDFNDFLEYLEDNKTPLQEELVRNVMYMYKRWGLSLTDLLIIVNARIYPLKLVQNEVSLEYDPIVMPDEIKKCLQIIDTRDSLTGIISSETLPPETFKVNDSFSIHEGNIISYKGKEILLEPQERRFAALLLHNTPGQYICRDDLLINGLHESYVENSESSKNLQQRITDTVSQLRSKFKNATGIKKNYFPNKTGVGYKFDP